MFKFRKSLIGAAIGACAVLGVQLAQAASVSSVLFDGLQQLSDNSAESLIKGQGNTGGATILEQGDRLRGIFTIDTVEPLQGQGGGLSRDLGQNNGNNELAGIFDITVAAKIVTFDGVTGLPLYTFIFAPTAGFGASMGLGVGSNASVVFFEDTNGEFSRINSGGCTTTGAGGDCENLITDGTLLLAMTQGTPVPGLGTGGYWLARNVDTDDISDIANTAFGSVAGLYNLALDVVYNATGHIFNGVACGTVGTALRRETTDGLEVCGSGSLLGTDDGDGNPATGATPYDSFDNVDFTVNVTRVPEPGSVALLGAAMLGLGIARRRTNRTK